jgi:hypothetical protein
MDTQPEELSQT